MQKYIEASEYHAFIQASHRRFHPDRWRARGLLTAVANSEERERLECAVNIVAQALSPLWEATSATT
jgi:hypothetical protein